MEGTMSESRNFRQYVVAKWAEDAFGKESMTLPYRGVRMLEEAIECYQSCGGNVGMAHALIDYVFSHEPGKLNQEIGGVGTTLLTLAATARLSADEEEARELKRVLSKPLDHFRARNEAKNAAGFKL